MNKSSKPSILIVEDSLDIQESLKQLFESENYDVQIASHGQEALDYLRSGAKHPNIILLDLMMPIMDGYEFRKIQYLDEALSRIPVVIMTADGHVEEKSAKLGGAAFLKKPVDIDIILNTVYKYRTK